ncbi:hypothetical protein E2C01_038320 [Portunus trituberculatus]|uniref:Uncharacterized protein n=1 Tax=Portunus trituberculatus TaxID=210409 RepID=A0A5B7FHP8_PORTR|nr:hypothetical protein [Portunus trituberculatus]
MSLALSYLSGFCLCIQSSYLCFSTFSTTLHCSVFYCVLSSCTLFCPAFVHPSSIQFGERNTITTTNPTTTTTTITTTTTTTVNSLQSKKRSIPNFPPVGAAGWFPAG